MIHDVVRMIAGSPARAMLVVWALALALYFLGPIHYFIDPSANTWMFVFGCIGCFVAGSWAAFARSTRPTKKENEAVDCSDQHVDKVARTAALIGIVGILFIAVDKLLLSGLDYSQGITAVRFERAAEVRAGTAGELRRSPLLYIGSVIFTASVPANLLCILRGDSMRKSTVWMGHLSLIPPVLYSFIYGGRSPIGLVIGMMAGAVVVRVLSGRRVFPKSRGFGAIIITLAIFSTAYNEYIFSKRLEYMRVEDYNALSQRFEMVYEAEPTRSVDELVASGALDPELAKSILLNSYYVTHGLGMLDRILHYDGPLGPYYGSYQAYLLAILMSRTLPVFAIEQQMLVELVSARVYGWFSTAWAGMYLDFGLYGSLFAVLACGFASGRVYRKALIEGSLSSELLMCYVVAGIVATPLLSIFTISIGLPIFISLAITAFFLRPKRGAAAQVSAAPGKVAVPVRAAR
jgi:hypothetical protein